MTARDTRSAMPASPEPTRVLVLGGTGEEAALARVLADDPEVAAIVSLAGVTRAPAPLAIPTRRGGFGGAEGLARHLIEGGFERLVDATHPFAAQISRHAVEAARAARVPLLRFSRPPWAAVEGDRWTLVADASEAAAALPAGAKRVFLAIGRRDLSPFSIRREVQFLVRLIEPPSTELPLLNHRLLLERGPFDPAREVELFRRLRVDVVVAKNAGGAGARAKLDAARELSLPVVMIARPPLPAAPETTELAEALAWIKA